MPGLIKPTTSIFKGSYKPENLGGAMTTIIN